MFTVAHCGGVNDGNGNIEAVRRWVVSGEPIDVRSPDGHTPLIWAALYNKDDRCVSELLRLGADVRAVAFDGSTALHRAGPNRNEAASEAIVRALVAAGCDVAAVDRYGRTAVDWARRPHGETRAARFAAWLVGMGSE